MKMHNRDKIHCINGHLLAETSVLRKHSNGRNSRRCKECAIVYSKQYRENPKNIPNKVKAGRKANLKKFGLSFKTFEVLINKQNNKCRICKEKFGKKKNNKPNIDHDHKTGKVRGLLCLLCNVSLGGFRDSAKRLRNAIKYLEKYN